VHANTASLRLPLIGRVPSESCRWHPDPPRDVHVWIPPHGAVPRAHAPTTTPPRVCTSWPCPAAGCCGHVRVCCTGLVEGLGRWSRRWRCGSAARRVIRPAAPRAFGSGHWRARGAASAATPTPPRPPPRCSDALLPSVAACSLPRGVAAGFRRSPPLPPPASCRFFSSASRGPPPPPPSRHGDHEGALPGGLGRRHRRL